MLNMIKKLLNRFVIFSSLAVCLFLTISCGSDKKPTSAVTTPTNALERARQNVDEGRGFSLKGLTGSRKTNYEFSTSNPMWRATLDTLDFIPFSTVDYSGGLIITDWYSDGSTQNESIKITVRFLSNEIKSNSLKIIVHQKNCKIQNNCSTKIIKSKIGEELLRTILSTASLFEKNNNIKK